MLTWLAFLVYAGGLIWVARHFSHHFFHGWVAKLVSLAAIAIGLRPWVNWMTPRLMIVLGWVGKALCVICYFTVLVPWVIIARLSSDPLRQRPHPGTSYWIPRKPLPTTLEAAQAEY